MILKNEKWGKTYDQLIFVSACSGATKDDEV